MAFRFPFSFRSVRTDPVLAAAADLDGELSKSRNALEEARDRNDEQSQGWNPFSGRERAGALIAMFRAVTLLSSLLAQLLSKPGGVRVVDRDGRRVRGPRAEAVEDMLTNSMDGGISDSHASIEDWGMDYALGGNVLLVPSVMADGRLTRIRQFDSLTAKSSLLRYTLEEAIPGAVPEDFAARDVMHIRYGIWPNRRTRPEQRFRMGPSPLDAASNALLIGLAMDAYILGFFQRENRGAIKSDHAIILEDELTDTQLARFYQNLVLYLRGRAPLILERAKIQSLRNKPSDADAEKLRQAQVEEIARLYGFPPVMLGAPVTNWGTGVKQLKSFLFSFAVQQHLNRFISPLSRRLLPKGQTIRVETFDLLRGDLADLTNLLRVGLGGTQNHGFMGREHALRVLGWPVEWADQGMDAIPGATPPAQLPTGAPEEGEDGEE